jgi:hypothetical protein
LPLLHFDLIREHPKIFMGYADFTVLNVAIWQMTGHVTFNGPALMVELAEYPEGLRLQGAAHAEGPVLGGAGRPGGALGVVDGGASGLGREVGPHPGARRRGFEWLVLAEGREGR